LRGTEEGDPRGGPGEKVRRALNGGKKRGEKGKPYTKTRLDSGEECEQ